MRYTEIEIVEQGAPIVNTAIVREQTENFAIIEVDLKSKNCEIAGTTSGGKGASGVVIEAGEFGIKLAENVLREKMTTIAFPEFQQYSNVYSVELSRYTLRAVLEKVA